MKIRDLLAAESIELNGKVTGKKEALDAMVDLMAKSGKINDVEVYRKGVYAREEESTTGIGEGIAIPHCKSDSVSRPGLAAMVVPEGVDFDSLDGEKVNLIFFDRCPEHKRERSSRRAQQIVCVTDGRGFYSKPAQCKDG